MTINSEKFRLEWRVISEARRSFAILFLAVISVTGGVAHILYQHRLDMLKQERDRWKSESEYWEDRTRHSKLTNQSSITAAANENSSIKGDMDSCFGGNAWGCFLSSAESLSKTGDAERFEVSVDNINALVDLRARHLAPEVAGECRRETQMLISAMKAHFTPESIEQLRSKAPVCLKN